MYALGEFVHATKGLSAPEALPLILKDILSLTPRFKCHVWFHFSSDIEFFGYLKLHTPRQNLALEQIIVFVTVIACWVFLSFFFFS